ncbi:MAG: outer membrane protein assembly factor BamB family protein [Pirellulaceae bacterium]
MRVFVWISCLLGYLPFLDPTALAYGADWPTWRGDGARSSVTAESLPAALALHWKLQLSPARPAWPAEQGKIRFDASYEPVVARGLVFVPSMVDDSVAAYRLADGERLWRFYTEGPVRFAPVVHGDRVLFVSDDGYLYCVAADRGALLWKLRGGPQDRKLLGNDRLISMWPARGAPVVFGETVYFAAGIWPFMGVFVHAVDIGTGQPIWTNSGSGANYIVQQHNSPAFAGIAPQGYLAVNDTFLLVSGGMTVPAVFERQTGRFVYYRPGDQHLGKDQGGYEVLLGPDWFANHGRLHRLTDGEPLVQMPVDLITPQSVLGVSDKHLVVSQTRIVRYVETSVDKKGNETRTVKHKLPESFRVPLPAGLTQIHIQAGDRLVASDGGTRVALLNIPQTEADACRIEWETYVESGVWQTLVADGRLITVGHDATIRCYGAADQAPATPRIVNDAPELVTRDATASAGVVDDVTELLRHTESRQGYAVVDQPRDLPWLLALAHQSEFHIVALLNDQDAILSLREALRVNGLLGTRVAVVQGNLRTVRLPLYLAELTVANPAQMTTPPDAEYLTSAFASLRPYSGVALLPCPKTHQSTFLAALSRFEQEATLETAEARVILRRNGPLPGAGTWTSQNGDAGNTLVSGDTHVRSPLGVLWFGGPSNRDVLPRHGHGPIPHVIGGRLFIEGRDMLRAVDVYTGRLLWQREFPEVGIFYDTTDHHPGAGAIGGNYVCTSDSVYLAWGRRCLRLDPATGDTLAEFSLPPDDAGEQPYWGYLGVQGDHLVAGSSPMLLLAPAPGEKLDDKDPDQLQRVVSLYSPFGEGSRRLVIMDRWTGQVRWMRDARYNFRHNAIAMGDGKIFCLDRMTEKRLAHFRRRGEIPVSDFYLYALDLATGDVIWESAEHAFGTWLAYSSHTRRLLQGGSKSRDRADDEVGAGLAVFDGLTGNLVWHVSDDYAGPPLFYPDTIVTQGTAYDLATGARKKRLHPLTGEERPWQFARNYGCTTAIGCVNLLTFRSAAAGYFDLVNDGGTGNWGGFRSSCTPNLVPADGVLNAPEYTRTCTCSYQNQCSLALVHMPEVETWTFNAIPSGNKRVQRLGINFAAPGDRKDADGTLWLDYPSVGGPSPDVPLTLTGDSLEFVRDHASLIASDMLPWVLASGVRGARHIQIRLAGSDEVGAETVNYVVQLYWRDISLSDLQISGMKTRLQGQSSPTQIRALADSRLAPDVPDSKLFVQRWQNVVVGEFLEVDLPPAPDAGAGAAARPLLCGIEIILQSGG